ncbi:MAG TPA: phosphoglycerate mutase family protein [Vicinamibacterales bacterium]|nr:phosphoglycerate mutase family protein [Vicinamibacterales bacterium]
MHVYLVHHGEAVGPEVDLRRPLSPRGRETCERLAAAAAARGARPDVVWHSGKLRARQTAEIFWRACNALAEFAAVRDLQPDDRPAWMRDTLRVESRDVLIAGHFPHLPALLAALRGEPDNTVPDFPVNGMVALRTDDGGDRWIEEWRLAAPRE